VLPSYTCSLNIDSLIFHKNNTIADSRDETKLLNSITRLRLPLCHVVSPGMRPEALLLSTAMSNPAISGTTRRPRLTAEALFAADYVNDS